jgi:hypothetical protein
LKRLLTLILLLTLLVPVGITSAGDPAIGSPDDNACNKGGVMDGKCGTDPWAWVCGWYLARWQSNGGWLTPNNPFNDACASLLPPHPVPASDAAQNGVITICKVTGMNTLCFSSDQIGTSDANTDGVIDFLFLFTNAPVGVPPLCPANYGGKTYVFSILTANYSPPFTATELFSTLALGVNVCAYA